MILVREVFELHFGKSRQAVAAAKAWLERSGGSRHRAARLLTDLTGPHYTLVWETEFPDLASFERELAGEFDEPDWRGWYEGFAPFVRSGRWEVYTIVD